MAECPICKKPLVCKAHGVQQAEWSITGWISSLVTPTPQVKSCPLKKGAIWIHVTDESGNDIKDVLTTVNATKKTERPGISIFDQLDPDTYDAKLEPLPVDIAKRYDPPDQMVEKATVTDGKVTYVNFVLKRQKWKLKVEVTSATPGAWPENVNLTLPSPLSNTTGKCDNAPWVSTLDGTANVDGDAVASSDGWDLVEQPQKVKLEPGDSRTIAFSLKRKPWIKFLVKKKLDNETKVFSKLKVKAKVPGWTGPEFTTDRAETYIQKLDAGTGEIEAMTADESWEFESIASA